MLRTPCFPARYNCSRYSLLIDPLAGTIAPIPIGPDVEAGVPQWTRDGKIVARGTMYAMSIWRFHPAP